MMSNYYLGVDPGTANIGWALVSPDAVLFASGVIHIPPEDREQFCKAYADLQAMYERVAEYNYYPHYMIISLEAFAMMGSKASVVNAFNMGQVVQLVRMTANEMLFRFTIKTNRNRDVRQWLCGSWKAKPSQVKAALENMGYTERMNEHTRDALALALYAKWMIENEGGN